MEDARWLRLVAVGLVLAAIAVGYFILAQRFTGRTETTVVQATPSPAPTSTSSPTLSAYQRIAERTRNNTQTLPATGSPALLIGLLSIAAIIAGFGLCKFPK